MNKKNDQTPPDEFYFDDCPICRAMREGRANTEEGLKAAFDEAKKMQEQ
jgi:hypothetical protein